MSETSRTYIGPWFLFVALGSAVLGAYAGFSVVILGAFSAPALTSFAGSTCLNVAAIALAARAFGRTDRLKAAATAFLVMTTFGLLVSIALTVTGVIYPGGKYALFLILAPLLPSLLILFFDLGLGAGSLAVGLILLIAGVDVLTTPEDANGPGLGYNPATAPDPARIYPKQAELLADQIGGLAPGEAGQVELFAVLGAGHPFQGVFAREVIAIGDLLTNDFGAEDRIVSLVNSARDPDARPLLTAANLTTALKGTADAMNRDEDILLLFLTSHGQPDTFSINFGPLIRDDLTPDAIGAALDASGITHSVVIVSACFSGSFVEALEGDNRLILTAAARDRSSFGCSDTNEWTDWGRAFFVDSLPLTRNFIAAAQNTLELVKEREVRAGYEASNPQISIGRNIAAQLDRWMTDREGRR